ncbi:lysylphosphatidylglycerol synthase domain-containing protein [Chloroflexota bacterium]
MKNKTRQLVSITTLIIVAIGIGFYLKANERLLLSLSNISLASAFWLIVFRILFLATNGLFLRAFAAKFDIQLTIKEWVGIPIVTAMGNYVTPFSGGMIARAAYLKYRHAFPYARFATLLASNYLVNFWVVGVIGFLASLTFISTSRFFWQIPLFFIVVVGGISMLVILPSVKLSWNNRLSEVINTSLEGWTLVKNDKLLLVKLVIYSLANILLNGLSFWIAYAALGVYVSFIEALLIGLLAVFSILLNITPGNLGVQEAVVGLSSALLGTGAGHGLLAALLIRSSTMIIVFTLGPVFSYILTRDLTTE